MPMNDLDQHATPELLYLLQGDPAELREALLGLRAADIAEALHALAPDAAARVTAALPFDLAVQVFDEPELEHQRLEIVKRMEQSAVGPLVEAMSADQQADLFRDLPESDRSRLLKSLDEGTRHTLIDLLRYEPDTAGGIMTTEFVSVPATWTVDETLQHVPDSARDAAVADVPERHCLTVNWTGPARRMPFPP